MGILKNYVLWFVALVVISVYVCFIEFVVSFLFEASQQHVQRQLLSLLLLLSLSLVLVLVLVLVSLLILLLLLLGGGGGGGEGVVGQLQEEVEARHILGEGHVLQRDTTY